jgi:uncharacterized protein with gpF-like domain
MIGNIMLTKRKAKWAQNRNVALRGTDLRYNISQQLKYERALKKLVQEMTAETKKEIARLFKSKTAREYVSAQDASIGSQARILMNGLLDKFNQLFSFKSRTLAERMVNGAANASKATLHTSLKQLSGGLSLNTGVIPKGMEEIAKALIAENVSLIKSIPQEYFKNVTGAVMRSIMVGNGLADLLPHIKKYDGQTERRAKNLSLDQTRKAYNSINGYIVEAVKSHASHI